MCSHISKCDECQYEWEEHYWCNQHFNSRVSVELVWAEHLIWAVFVYDSTWCSFVIGKVLLVYGITSVF